MFSSPFCNSQCLKNTKWWYVRTHLLYSNTYFNVLKYRRLGLSCSFYSTRLMLNQCRLTVILEYCFLLRSACSRTMQSFHVNQNNCLSIKKKKEKAQHSIVKSLAMCFSGLQVLLVLMSISWLRVPEILIMMMGIVPIDLYWAECS